MLLSWSTSAWPRRDTPLPNMPLEIVSQGRDVLSDDVREAPREKQADGEDEQRDVIHHNDSVSGAQLFAVVVYQYTP